MFLGSHGFFFGLKEKRAALEAGKADAFVPRGRTSAGMSLRRTGRQQADVPRSFRTYSAVTPGPLFRIAGSPQSLIRYTSEHCNKSIAFPKLHVVLAVHLLGSTSRRLLVNAIELCGADHSPIPVHHEHFVPHDGSPEHKRGPHHNRMLG